MILFPAVIAAIENDDDRAFMEKLYLDHRYLMFKVARGIVDSPHAAEDMVAEACVSLIENIDTLRKINSCKLRSYIVSTVRNASIDYVRKRNRRSRYGFSTDKDDVLASAVETEEIDDALIRQAESEKLRRALGMIHEKERKVLQMKYFDLLQDAEIAQRMEIKPNSVRSYLTKARRSLKEALKEVECSGSKA